MKEDSPDWLSIVREKVESLRYGIVQIVVHDSKVTQIERTEKTRIVRQGTKVAATEINNSNRPDNLEEP